MLADIAQVFKFVSEVKEVGAGVASGDKSYIEKNADKIMNLQGTNGNIVSLLKRYIVEPTIYVSHNAKNLPETHDAINFMLNIFTSMYSNAFSILANQYDLSPDVVVSLLGTGGGGKEASIKIGSKVLSAGVNKFYKGSPEAFPIAFDLFNNSMFLSTEGTDLVIYDEEFAKSQQAKQINEQEMRKKLEEELVKRQNNNIKNFGSMKTTAKEFATVRSKTGFEIVKNEKDPEQEIFVRNIEFKIGMKQEKHAIVGMAYLDGTTDSKNVSKTDDITITIPISIRANVVYLDPKELVLALSTKKDDIGFFRRFEQYRSGGISFKEFIFCTDLIKAYRKNKIKDVNNIVGGIDKSQSSAKWKFAVHGAVGYEKNYNMFVLTSDDDRMINNALNIDLFKTTGKQKFLDSLNGYSVMIMDPMAGKTKICITEIDNGPFIDTAKLKKKGKESDIQDLAKVLLTGQTPRF